MAGPLKDLPESPRAERAVVVLSVSPLEETHSRLRGIFKHTNWSLRNVPAFREAVGLLSSHGVGVVICERDLPDGTWKDMLDAISRLPDQPLLIVTSHDADERLWAEVLSLGGYDVLPRPFETAEVTRVISIAWQHWQHCRKPVRAVRGSSNASRLRTTPA